MFFEKFKELCKCFLTSLLEYHQVITTTFISLHSFFLFIVLPFLSLQQVVEELSNAKALLLKSKKKKRNDVVLMMPFPIGLAVILMIL